MKPILVLDFGSQFAHLIANRIRRLSAYSEIVPVSTPAEEILAMNPAGIILSGGPQSVFAEDSPQPDPKIFDIDIPFFGICYGHQLLAQHHGATIESRQKEYGEASFTHTGGMLFKSVPSESTVWMNHGDSVVSLPEGFTVVGQTKDCEIAAFENKKKHIYSVQFHPEVTHSEYGMQMLENFVDICDAKGSWKMEDVMKDILEKIQEKAGNRNVFLLVSGGVDSSVAFALLTKALGEERIVGLLVDHGFMRQDEAKKVQKMFAELGYHNLKVAEVSEHFFEQLAGVYDPEEKRGIIGKAFLEVQQQWTKKLELDTEHWLLGQGTIYPDHIETGGSEHASKIKTHHNRVPEIEALMEQGLVIEPLADFYKDEVREIGRLLGLPEAMIERHPFPGPGLAVRILCQESADVLEGAEAVEKEGEAKYGFQSRVLPIKSVGVQGDARSYKHPLAIYSPLIRGARGVLEGDTTLQELLPTLTKIPNAIHDINRVVVCLSHDQAPETFFALADADLAPARAELLRQADDAVQQMLEQHGLVEAVWQFPVVLLPLGVKKGTESIVLRPIQSENAMTATPVVFEQEILEAMTKKILEIDGISAVYLDVTSKPPGTIEWE